MVDATPQTLPVTALATLIKVSGVRKEAFRFWADGYQGLHRLSQLVSDSGLEPELLELVKMRALLAVVAS